MHILFSSVLFGCEFCPASASPVGTAVGGSQLVAVLFRLARLGGPLAARSQGSQALGPVKKLTTNKSPPASRVSPRWPTQPRPYQVGRSQAYISSPEAADESTTSKRSVH